MFFLSLLNYGQHLPRADVHKQTSRFTKLGKVGIVAKSFYQLDIRKALAISHFQKKGPFLDLLVTSQEFVLKKQMNMLQNRGLETRSCPCPKPLQPQNLLFSKTVPILFFTRSSETVSSQGQFNSSYFKQVTLPYSVPP